VFAWVTEPEKYKVSVDFSRLNKGSLENVFVRRTQARYNEKTAITDSLLSKADRAAFAQWAAFSEHAREDEVSFWSTFIGRDQKRLAQAVAFLFPGNAVWSQGPAPSVDKLFPLNEFQRLIDTIPQVDHLEEHELSALDRLLAIAGLEVLALLSCGLA